MNKRKYVKIFLNIAFFIYILAAMYFLLFAESMGRTTVSDGYRYNLILFKEIKRFIVWSMESPIGFRSMLLNVLGNIVCFVPLGFLVPSVINFKNKFLAVVIVAFSSVLMVEVIQLVTKIGSFDVDDILLNVSGAMLGYGIYVIAKKFWNIKNNNKNKS